MELFVAFLEIRKYDQIPIITVPKSQGDPKIVKRGPKGDPIFWQKGDPKGNPF